MRSLASKLAMLSFATLLGRTCGASAAQQSIAGDNRQYPNATTCTRLRAICLSSQPDCNIPAGVGLRNGPTSAENYGTQRPSLGFHLQTIELADELISKP